MSSSHQSAWSTLIAIGFGATAVLALQSNNAIGYPAGASISLGSNPVDSHGGYLRGNDTGTTLSAPSDTALVVTDIHLSLANANSYCEGAASIVFTAGERQIAVYGIGAVREGGGSHRSKQMSQFNASMQSGLRVEPGETLAVASTQLWQSSCDDNKLKIHYTVSGYYAQP